ncbi:MAG: OmpA family protein [Flavobacteriia bacterium]|nr:OmpA family protein [Flavobacteriia bacterium]
MMRILSIFIYLNFSFFSFSQTDYNGLWQGFVIQNGKKIDQATPIYLNLTVKNGIVEGKIREEIVNTDLYALKKTKFELKNNIISFKQLLIEKKKTSSKANWCLINAQLTYIDSTGYLEGKYSSTDCKGVSGKIILYRSQLKFSESEIPIQSHSWIVQFANDLKNGEKAPEIRALERKNFVFQPIYFDYDKAEIKEEYYAFLIQLIKVVNGHTDLRIKVTGNTDSDGSDLYNEDLSRRRAQAITDFFVQHGLKADRLKIEFNGEKNPIDSNNTPEGKQHNRRVEFEFI